MSNEIPTPRSREEWRRIQRLPDGSYSSKVTYGELAHGMSNFARQLERELAEVTKQRDELAEALRLATACPLTEIWYNQAIEALATLKPCD